MSSSAAGSILQGLIGQFNGDALASMQGLLTAFGQALVINPSQENLIAQALALAATAPLQIPNLEQESIGQFGAAVVKLAALITPVAPVTMPAAPTAPAVAIAVAPLAPAPTVAITPVNTAAATPGEREIN
jgi:hypothetical protein